MALSAFPDKDKAEMQISKTNRLGWFFFGLLVGFFVCLFVSFFNIETVRI